MPNYRGLAVKYAVQEAKRLGLPPARFAKIFVEQIIQESGFQVAPSGRDAQGNILPNSSGAVGIAQIVPRWHPNVDATDPDASLRYAARHTAQLWKKYGNPEQALSVYNSGKPDTYRDPNFASGQTYNYVRRIMSAAGDRKMLPGLAKADGNLPSTQATSVAGPGLSSALTADSFKSALGAELIAMSTRAAQGQAPDFSGLIGLAAMKRSLQASPLRSETPQPDGVSRSPGLGGAPGPSKFRGGLPELFYDPEGGIKHGQEIGAIGGHGNHVHISFGSPAMRYAALQRAKAMGLTIREDGVHDDVDPVHTKTSNHYRTFPGTNKAQAADLSGTPEQMQAYYRWARATFV